MSQLLLTIFLFSVLTLLDTNEVFFCHGSDNFTTSTVSAYHTEPAHTRFYDFQLGYLNVTRLNKTKTIVAVNGQFPGPAVYANEGDRLVIKLTSNVKENVSIHWHGVLQLLSNWADGTAYISQCPLGFGETFTHRFRVTGQTGTILWHAHITWLRATLYGPLIIHPQDNQPYPWDPQPVSSIPILVGEWWTQDTEEIERTALRTGGAPTKSDAITINGMPGRLYNHSPDDVFRVKVTHGKTYYLRVINAALEIAVFFAVANHSLTVVELDASYVKPFTVNTIMLTPGQTADVLLHANQSSGQFYMAASAYSVVQYDLQQYPRIAGTGILQYELADDRGPTPNILAMVPTLPNLPGYNDSAYSDSFLAKIKSYNNSMYKVDQVPLVIDQEFFFTVGYALEPNNSCPPLKVCKGYLHQRFSAAVNNISFQNPTNISLLEAFYFNKSISESFKGFPDTPVHKFNYTGPEDQLGNKAPVHSTKVSVLNFNDQVQLVLQDISILNFTIHPFHLHGHNFYVVGWGYGNYDSLLDPPYFNLEDPPLRNTAGVPSGGWLAIRFRANNPGVWLLHCHFEMHLSWGMEMAFVVKNGVGVNQTLPPPPHDMPRCKKQKPKRHH